MPLCGAHPFLQRVTKNHVAMKCYGLGLGLDTFRMVALDANFRRLEEGVVASTYARWAQLAHVDVAEMQAVNLAGVAALGWERTWRPARRKRRFSGRRQGSERLWAI